MTNVVSIAINSAKTLYGATDDTEWYVTFMTNDVKLGRVIPVNEDIYVLLADKWMYFFDEHQVVHMSPHLRHS